MQQFEARLKKERKLYRELFINAQKTFKELLKKMKEDFSCSECRTCCNVRYSRLPPEEIYRLSSEENDQIAGTYIKFFVPYGAGKNFEYSDNTGISPETNNKAAINSENELNSGYVKKILQKHSEPVYFYYCKNTGDGNNCSGECQSCLRNEFPDSVTMVLPDNCSFRHWQNLVVHRIKNEIGPEVELKIRQVLDYREKFKCKRSGICCRLASSEYSYAQLKQKAQNNDEFARQFTEIFIPYKDINEARAVFPEYVDLLVSRVGKGEEVNFYRCKHLKGTNECPVYDSRPQICRDFPDDPLSIIPPGCGYYAWKEEIIVAALTFQAMRQIYNFYLEKINDALN